MLDHVRANPGQRTEEIGAALGMVTSELQLPMSKLVTEGWIRSEGQRGGTRYFAGGGRGGRKAKAAKMAVKKGTKKGRRKATRRDTRRGTGAPAPAGA